MLTIFSCPKPFIGHINIIQRNAIQSWLKLTPKCEVILFGDDEGVNEVAKEFDLIHIPKIEKSKQGTPLLSSVFNYAQNSALNDTLVFVNADIILFNDLINSIKNINFPKYLVSGRRWDLDINQELIFETDDWKDELLEKVKKEGRLHKITGKDYFIFKKGTVKMLPLAVGRVFWDDWFLYHMRQNGIPIINATNAIKVIHQNHDYSHSKFGKKTHVSGPEMKDNYKLIGGGTNILSLKDADWSLYDFGLKKPPIKYLIFNILSYFYVWRLLMNMKYKISRKLSRLGIRNPFYD
tara:strand:+ start:2683 stop:3564 length:882 start_codon:yes stop_codon:yes gene_type:complete